MIYLMHQPGGHMCLRRVKKILYLAAQDASNDMKGGLMVMGKRILVHSDRYKPEVQLIGSTPKELLAMDEAMALATAEFDRAVNVENLSPAQGRKLMRLFLEGKGVAGAERVPERDVPLSSVGEDLEEFDTGVLCLFGDNTSSVSAVRKGVSSNPHMMRCLDNIMVSYVKTDFAAFSFYLSGPEMEGNGIDDISRGKTEAVRTMGDVGLHVKANTVLNPFARQSWGLPLEIRARLEKRFGDKVKYFACGNGLTAVECANDVVCIYPTPSTAVQLVDHACEVLDLCRHSMTLIMVCVKDFATPHMRSLLRRFDKQSNGQHAVLLPVLQGEAWSRYLAVKMPRKRPLITNSIVYDYCSSIVRAGSDSVKLNEVLGSWMAKYGEAAVASRDGTSSGAVEMALSNCECDVSLLNSEIQEGVLLGTARGGILPEVGMTAYQPRVVRASSGEIKSRGMSSDLRLSRRERGFIVQHVTEVILPSRDRGVAVVRKFTQGWKVVSRPKNKLIVAGQGRCEFLFNSHDLERKGGRMYRLRAFFVAGAAGTFTWKKVKRGVSWNPGHVLQPIPGQQVLCRLVYAKWAPARLPLFWGDAFISSVLGKKPFVEAKGESMMVMKGTLSGKAKTVSPPPEPQGADLCRAAGLGASMRGRLSHPRKRFERVSLASSNELEGEGETEVVGDLLGRKLTGAMAARGHDASAECTRCAL
jgi:hypothetical protein